MSKSFDEPEDVESWGVRVVADWGVPDWTKSKGYPDPKKFTPWQWAWEFRRRNADYRLSWIEGSKSAPFDPTKPAHPLFEKGLVRVIDGPGEAPLSDEQAAIVINVRSPLVDQLLAASRILEQRYPEIFRPSFAANCSRLRPNDYNLYLRALDGQSAGADVPDMARALEKSRAEVRRYLEIGSELSWSHYRLIARKGPARPSRKQAKS